MAALDAPGVMIQPFALALHVMLGAKPLRLVLTQASFHAARTEYIIGISHLRSFIALLVRGQSRIPVLTGFVYSAPLRTIYVRTISPPARLLCRLCLVAIDAKGLIVRLVVCATLKERDDVIYLIAQ